MVKSYLAAHTRTRTHVCMAARCWNVCFVCCGRSLRVLHFFNYMSGNGGAKAVATIVRASPLLEDLRFSSTRGGHDGGMELAAAIGTLTTLRRLDLNDNTFGPEVGVALGRALERQKHIEVVNLGDTSTCFVRHATVAAVLYDVDRGAEDGGCGRVG